MPVARRGSSSSSKRNARNIAQPLLDSANYLSSTPVITYEEVQIDITIDAEWVDVCRDYPFFNDVCFHVVFPGSVEPVVTPPISSWAFTGNTATIFPADESPEPTPLHPSLFNPLRKGSYTITLTMSMDLSRIYSIEDIDLTITPHLRTAILDPTAVASHWHTLTALQPLLSSTTSGADPKRTRRNNPAPNASQPAASGSTAPSRRGRRASMSRASATQVSPFVNPLIPAAVLSCPFTAVTPISMSLAPLLLTTHHTPTTPPVLAASLESLAKKEKSSLISHYVNAGAVAQAAVVATATELAERKPKRQGTQGSSAGSNTSGQTSRGSSNSNASASVGSPTDLSPANDALPALAASLAAEDDAKTPSPPPPPVSLRFHADDLTALPVPLPLPFTSLAVTVTASAPLLTPQLQALLLPLAVDVDAISGMQNTDILTRTTSTPVTLPTVTPSLSFNGQTATLTIGDVDHSAAPADPKHGMGISSSGTGNLAGTGASSVTLPSPASYHAAPHFNTALHAALLTSRSELPASVPGLDSNSKTRKGEKTNISEKDKSAAAMVSPLLPVPLPISSLERMGSVVHDTLITASTASSETLRTLAKLEGGLPLAQQPRIAALLSFFPQLLAPHIASSREAHYARSPPSSVSFATDSYMFPGTATAGGNAFGHPSSPTAGGSFGVSISPTARRSSTVGFSSSSSEEPESQHDKVSALVDAAVLRHTLIFTRPAPVLAQRVATRGDIMSGHDDVTPSVAFNHRHVILLGRLGPQAIVALAREATATSVPVTVGPAETLTVLARAYAKQYGLPVPSRQALPHLSALIYDEEAMQASSRDKNKARRARRTALLIDTSGAKADNSSDTNADDASATGNDGFAQASSLPALATTVTSAAPSPAPSPLHARRTLNRGGNANAHGVSADARGGGKGLAVTMASRASTGNMTVNTPAESNATANNSSALTTTASTATAAPTVRLAYPAELDDSTAALLSGLYTSACPSACGVCQVCVAPLYAGLHAAFTGAASKTPSSPTHSISPLQHPPLTALAQARVSCASVLARGDKDAVATLALNPVRPSHVLYAAANAVNVHSAVFTGQPGVAPNRDGVDTNSSDGNSKINSDPEISTSPQNSYLSALSEILPPTFASLVDNPLAPVALMYFALPSIAASLMPATTAPSTGAPNTNTSSNSSNANSSNNAAAAAASIAVANSEVSTTQQYRTMSLPPPTSLLASLAQKAPQLASMLPSGPTTSNAVKHAVVNPVVSTSSTISLTTTTTTKSRRSSAISTSTTTLKTTLKPTEKHHPTIEDKLTTKTPTKPTSIPLITALHTHVHVALRPSQPLPTLPSPLLPLPTAAASDPTVALISAASPYILSPLHQPLCTHDMVVCSCDACTAPTRPALSYPDPARALFPTADITIAHVAHATSDAIRTCLHVGLAMRGESSGFGNSDSNSNSSTGIRSMNSLHTQSSLTSPAPPPPAASTCSLKLCAASTAINTAVLAPLSTPWPGAWQPPLAPPLLALLQTLGVNVPLVPLFMSLAQSGGIGSSHAPAITSNSRGSARNAGNLPQPQQDTTVYSSRAVSLPSTDASFVLSQSSAPVDAGFGRFVFRIAQIPVASALLARISAHNKAVLSVLRNQPGAAAGIPDIITGVCVTDPAGALIVLEAPVPPTTLYARLGLTPSSLFTSISGTTQLLAPPIASPTQAPCLCPVIAPIPSILAQTNPLRYTIDPSTAPPTSTVTPVALLVALTASLQAQVASGVLETMFTPSPHPTHLSVAAPCLRCNTPLTSSHIFIPTLAAATDQCVWCLFLSQCMLLASLLFAANPQASAPAPAAALQGKARAASAPSAWNWLSPCLPMHGASTAVVNATAGLFLHRLNAWAKVESDIGATNTAPANPPTSSSSSSRGSSAADAKASSKAAAVLVPAVLTVTSETTSALLSTFTTPSEDERKRETVNNFTTNSSNSTNPTVSVIESMDTCNAGMLLSQSAIFSRTLLTSENSLSFGLGESGNSVLSQYILSTLQTQWSVPPTSLSALAALAETLIPSVVSDAMSDHPVVNAVAAHKAAASTPNSAPSPAHATTASSKTAPRSPASDAGHRAMQRPDATQRPDALQRQVSAQPPEPTQRPDAAQTPEISKHSEDKKKQPATTAAEREHKLSEFLLNSIASEAEPLLLLLSLAAVHRLHDQTVLTPMPGAVETALSPLGDGFPSLAQPHFDVSSASHNLADLTSLYSYNATMYSIAHPVRSNKDTNTGTGNGITGTGSRCHSDSPICMLPMVISVLTRRLLTLATDTLSEVLTSYLASPPLPSSHTIAAPTTKAAKGRRAGSSRPVPPTPSQDNDTLLQAIENARAVPLPVSPDPQTLAAAKRARAQAAVPVPPHTYATTGFGLHLLMQLVNETNDVAVELFQADMHAAEQRDLALQTSQDGHNMQGLRTMGTTYSKNGDFKSGMTGKTTLHAPALTTSTTSIASTDAAYNSTAVYGPSATWRQASAINQDYLASCAPVTVTQRDIAFGKPVTHTHTVTPTPAPPSASQRHPAALSPPCTVAFASKHVYNKRVVPLPSIHAFSSRSAPADATQAKSKARKRTTRASETYEYNFTDEALTDPETTPTAIMKDVPSLHQAAEQSLHSTVIAQSGNSMLDAQDTLLFAPGLETVNLPTRLGMLVDRMHVHRNTPHARPSILPARATLGGDGGEKSASVGDISDIVGTGNGLGVNAQYRDPSATSRAHFAGLLSQMTPVAATDATVGKELVAPPADGDIIDIRVDELKPSTNIGSLTSLSSQTSLAANLPEAANVAVTSPTSNLVDLLMPSAFAEAAAFLVEIEKTTLEIADELVVPLATGVTPAHPPRLLNKRTKFSVEDCTCIRGVECKCYETAIVDAVVRMPKSEVLREISAFMQ